MKRNLSISIGAPPLDRSACKKRKSRFDFRTPHDES
jgi:hypothetical protein